MDLSLKSPELLTDSSRTQKGWDRATSLGVPAVKSLGLFENVLILMFDVCRCLMFVLHTWNQPDLYLTGNAEHGGNCHTIHTVHVASRAARVLYVLQWMIRHSTSFYGNLTSSAKD